MKNNFKHGDKVVVYEAKPDGYGRYKEKALKGKIFIDEDKIAWVLFKDKNRDNMLLEEALEYFEIFKS